MVVPFGELLRFVIDEASKGYSKECFFWKKDFLGTSACFTSVFHLFFFLDDCLRERFRLIDNHVLLLVEKLPLNPINAKKRRKLIKAQETSLTLIRRPGRSNNTQ